MSVLLLFGFTLAAATERDVDALTHFVGGVIGNHAPTFTLNNNVWPFFADRVFVEDGGLYYVEQWACGVSDCNGGGDSLSFRFRQIDIRQPDPAAPTTATVSVADPAFFSSGPTGTPKREGDVMDPGVAVGNLFPDPNLCNGLPLVPCYGAGNPDSQDTGYGTLTFESSPDRWGIAYFEVWLEDDGIAFPLAGVDCQCNVDVVPCPVGQGNILPCNQQCNRGLVNQNPVFPIPAGSSTCSRQIFAINILPVNDPPAFRPLGNIRVDETINQNPQPVTTIPNFLCNIDHGGWREWPFQNIEFLIQTSDATFFERAPQIANVPAGQQLPCRDLTFTLNPGRCGVVTITLLARDDGLGDDTSEPFTFSLTVDPVNQRPSFVVSPDSTRTITVPEGASNTNNNRHLFPTWAQNIRGDPFTSCQSSFDYVKRFDLVPRNANCLTVFSEQPTIDSSSGDLHFTTFPYSSTPTGGCCYDVVAVDTFDLQSNPSTELCINVEEQNDPPTFTINEEILSTCEINTTTTNPLSFQWITNICAGSSDFALQCDPDEASQIVSFDVSPRNPNLFSVQPSISSTGILTFQTNAGVSGTTEVIVTATDNGTPPQRSRIASFSLVVEPVNTPPSATLGANVVVEEDSGPALLPQWLTGVSRGPGVEDSQQQLTIACSNNNPSLFSVAPDLTLNQRSAADLTFTPAANANGLATVTCVLTDDGGLGSQRCPGSDSQTITFPITIGAVDDPPFVELTESCIRPEWKCTSTSATVCTGQATGAQCTTDNIFTAVTVFEDEGRIVLQNLIREFGGGPPDENQVVQFEVSAADPSLFDPNVPILVDSTSGALSFKTADNAFGTTTITIVAIDSGGNRSMPRGIQLTIVPVNDPPVLQLTASDIIVDGCVAVPCPLIVRSNVFVAGSLTAGALNENQQSISLRVDPSQPNWFTQPPVVTAGGTLSFSLVAGLFPEGSYSQGMTLVATDDGVPPESSRTAFTLTVVVSNQPPRFEISPTPLDTPEDTPGVIKITAWARAITAGSESEDQSFESISFRCDISDPSLLKPNTGLDVSPSGVLTFEVAPNRFGTTDATCSIIDSKGAFFTRTFPFTVAPVNDCPVLQLVSQQLTIYDTEGESSHLVVLSASPGPFEDAQQLSFDVVPSRADVFLTNPVVRNNRLIVNVIPGRRGTVSMTITLRDNGGRSRGGCDQSVPARLDVFVEHANRRPTFELITNNIAVSEDVSSISTTSFVRNIFVGHAAEIGQQTVNCVVLTNSSSVAFFDIYPYLLTRLDSQAAELTFKPGPNVTGTFNFNVQCTDSGLSSPSPPHYRVSELSLGEFRIVVGSVNDPPYFDFEPNSEGIFVWEDSDFYRLPIFLKNIQAGPLNEKDQTTTANCVVRKSEWLFADPPVTQISNIDNGLNDKTADITFRIQPEQSGIAELECCVVDELGAGFCRTTTITVRAINDLPMFEIDTSKTLREVSSNSVVPVVVNRFLVKVVPGPDEEWLTSRVNGENQQTLTPVIEITSNIDITVDNSNQQIISPGSISLESTAAIPGLAGMSYNLLFNLLPGRCGSVSGSVTVTDTAGGMRSKQFSIEVECVNDPPSFIGGLPVTLCEHQQNAEEIISIPNWAREVTAGYLEDRAQRVIFSVRFSDIFESNCSRVFRAIPQITSAGELQISLSTNQNGYCLFIVSIRDNGTWYSPEVISYETALLRIDVQSVNDEPVLSLSQSPDGNSLMNGAIRYGIVAQESEFPLKQNIPNWCGHVAPGPLLADDELAEQKVNISIDLQVISGSGIGGVWLHGTPNVSIIASPRNASKFFEIPPYTTINPTLRTCDLNYKMLPFAWGNFTFVVTIKDDGLRTPCNGTSGLDTFGQPVILQVDIVAVNNPPVIKLSRSNITIFEDSPPTRVENIITQLGPGPFEPTQDLSVDITTTDTRLFGTPPVMSGGTLILTPGPNAVGVADLVFRAIDYTSAQHSNSKSRLAIPLNSAGTVIDSSVGNTNSLSSDAHFIVTVLPVNDPPSFVSATQPILLKEDTLGLFIVERWASGMIAGPVDESNQNLIFVVTYRDGVAGLGMFDLFRDFKTFPRVNPATGDLAFEISENIFGSFFFNVFLQDNGGSNPPNINSSEPHVLNIQIESVNDPPSFQLITSHLQLQRTDGAITTQIATLIRKGPDNEANQTVHFTLNITSTSQIFKAGYEPILSPDGVLSFTLNSMQWGRTDISILLHDSEGATSTLERIQITSERGAAGEDNFELEFATFLSATQQNEALNAIASMLAAAGPDNEVVSRDRINVISWTQGPAPSVLVFNFNDLIIAPVNTNAAQLSERMVAVLSTGSLAESLGVHNTRVHQPGGNIYNLKLNGNDTPLPKSQIGEDVRHDDPISSTDPKLIYILLGSLGGLLLLAAIIALIYYFCCRKKEKKSPPPPAESEPASVPPPSTVPTEEILVNEPEPVPQPQPVQVPPEAIRFSSAFPGRPPRDANVRTATHQAHPLRFFSVPSLDRNKNIEDDHNLIGHPSGDILSGNHNENQQVRSNPLADFYLG